jgi:hypothetical protein
MARAEITGRKPRVSPDRAQRPPGPPRADPDAVEPTAHRYPNSRAIAKTPPIRGPPVPAAAYSIREFCAAHRLSESMYFKLRNQGLGPDEMSIGSRRIISFEAAERWRREREAAAIDAA